MHCIMEGLWRFIAVITVAMLISRSQANHFRGGTISWKPLGGREVEFNFKLAWAYYGLSPGCRKNTINTLITSRRTDYWKCSSGCPTPMDVGSTDYICSGVNKQENWEMGENTFKHMFPTKGGPFKVSFSGNKWILLGNGKGNGYWNIETTVNLGKRSDTGSINSSPVSLSKPIFQPNLNCEIEFHIPTVDADGDTIQCMWASPNQCKSVCNALPGAVLEEETCTLRFNTTAATGYQNKGFYAVALTIRDYPKSPMTQGTDKKTPSDALSSIPLQFLVQPISRPGPCDEVPQFVAPSPKENEVITAEEGDKVMVDLYADNGYDTAVKVTTIEMTGVLGMKASPVTPEGKRINTFKTTLTWQTAAKDIGNHLVCGRVINAKGIPGSDRCFKIMIVPKGCSSNPCQNSGKCNSNKGTYTCSCRPGFSGPNCEKNIDDCKPNACKNGGTCVDGINTFKCHCVPGYTGNVCETDIDECQSNPCPKGANCTDGINTYTCACPPGFSGLNCSIRDHCIPDPCKNNATCVNQVNKYLCVCQPGYTGINCQTDINECASNPCMNGGTCLDEKANFVCVCIPGFTGRLCQTDIDDCHTNPCLNGANCTDGINTYTCTCPPGFSGVNCSIDIDDCQPKPCKNGGTCIDGINTFTCNCVPGYAGNTCQTDIDECQPNPCLNGANCTDGINTYTCTCPPGFSGVKCSIDIDDCQPKPCKNGGTCIDGINTFTCNCVPGYAGNTCQTDIDECQPNPCLNGANCTDGINTYLCTCPPGFSGVNCKIRPNFCKPNPCKRGVCLNGKLGSSCKCPIEWMGKDCNTVAPILIPGTTTTAFGVTHADTSTTKTARKSATRDAPTTTSSVSFPMTTVGNAMTKCSMNYLKCKCVFRPTDTYEKSRTLRDVLTFFYGFPFGLAILDMELTGTLLSGIMRLDKKFVSTVTYFFGLFSFFSYSALSVFTFLAFRYCLTNCCKDDKIYYPRSKPGISSQAVSPVSPSPVNSPRPRDTDPLFNRQRRVFF